MAEKRLWMALAVFFDGIDGKVASMLDTRSEMGAVLDSKADVVSFAVLPGVAAYLFFHRSPDGGLLTTVAAWTAGIAAYLALGTPGAFLAVYFSAFCSIYIVFHPVLALLRRTSPARPRPWRRTATGRIARWRGARDRRITRRCGGPS